MMVEEIKLKGLFPRLCSWYSKFKVTQSGLEITISHQTLTKSETILSDGNSLPSDTMAKSELYLLVIKCFSFTEHSNVLTNLFFVKLLTLYKETVVCRYSAK